MNLKIVFICLVLLLQLCLCAGKDGKSGKKDSTGKRGSPKKEGENGSLQQSQPRTKLDSDQGSDSAGKRGLSEKSGGKRSLEKDQSDKRHDLHGSDSESHEDKGLYRKSDSREKGSKKKGSRKRGSNRNKDSEIDDSQGSKDDSQRKVYAGGKEGSKKGSRGKGKEGSKKGEGYRGKRGFGKRRSRKGKGVTYDPQESTDESEEIIYERQESTDESPSQTPPSTEPQSKSTDESPAQIPPSTEPKSKSTDESPAQTPPSTEPRSTPKAEPQTTPKTSSGTSGHCGTWGDGTFTLLNGQVHYAYTSKKIALLYQCNEENPEFVIHCQRESGLLARLYIKIGICEIVIDSSGIYVNNNKTKVPYTDENIHIRNCGIFTQIHAHRRIISVSLNMKVGVNVHMEKEHEACGICRGSKIISAEEWQQVVYDSMLPKGEADGEVIFLPNSLSELGLQYCHSIYGTYFPNIRYADEYIKICAFNYEYCDQVDKRLCTCSAFTQAAAIIGVEGCSKELLDWRTDNNVVCGKPNCIETHIYSECSPQCLPTCSNPHPVNEKGVVAGCTCPDGLVQDDIGRSMKCVHIDKCPCFYEKIYQPGETRKGSCNSECTCSGGKWNCSEENCPGTCKIAYGIQVKTFDGLEYSLSGNCQYIIYQSDRLIILAEIQTPSAQFATSVKSVTIILTVGRDEHSFMIKDDGTFTDMDLVHHISNNFYVKKHDNGVYCKIFRQVELMVSCSPYMEIYISITSELTNTKGLCGSYNHDITDELKSSTNIVESTPEEFSKSWQQYVCPAAEQQVSFDKDTRMSAEGNCSKLKTSDEFAKCHFHVDYRVYYERCVSLTCNSEDFWAGLCSALKNYVQECAEKGVLLHNWRKDICEKKCINNQVLQFTRLSCFPSCTSTSHICDDQGLLQEMCACENDQFLNSENICVSKENCDCQHRYAVTPAHEEMELDGKHCKCRGGRFECELSGNKTRDLCTGGTKYAHCSYPDTQAKEDLSCKTMHLPPIHQDKPCKPGCYCPDGMVKNVTGQCIPQDECPCSYGGIEYKSGSSFSDKCRKCDCNKGKWNCKEENCKSVCFIHGSGHIVTFDGLSYSFDGLCQYTLVEGEDGKFRISVQNEPCCDGSQICSRKVIIQTSKITLILQDGQARIEISKDCSLEKQEDTFSIVQVGLYQVITLENGAVLKWDNKTALTVMLSQEWTGKVHGLCGNNDKEQRNDFTTRSGAPVTQTSALVKSYADDSSCQETNDWQSPCDKHPKCKDWAHSRCEMIIKELFKECHSKVDPANYYQTCVKEACVCEMEGTYSGFCSSISSYALACLEVGACVNWRSPDLCPVFCDYYDNDEKMTWHYAACGSALVKTCSNQDTFNTFSQVHDGCFPRCSIDAPYLDPNSRTCVRLSDCSCSYEGKIIEANSEIVDQCGRTCYCNEGNVTCKEVASKTSAASPTEEATKTSAPSLRTEAPETSLASPTEEASKKSPPTPTETTPGATPASPGAPLGATPASPGAPLETTPGATPASPGAPLETTPGATPASPGAPPVFTFAPPLPGPILPEQPTIDLSSLITPTPTDTKPQIKDTKPQIKGCCTPSGEFVNDGGSWEKDCIKCTCNGNTGKMDCGPYLCDEKVVCGINETKVFGDPSKHSRESCCGYCVPLTCKHNGTEYKINESFRDPKEPCLIYTCHARGLTAETTKCPQHSCLLERRKYDKYGCCYTCDGSCKTMPTKLTLVNPFIQSKNKVFKNCSGVVDISTCNGACTRSVSFDGQKVKVQCKCCKEDEHYVREVWLNCSNGSKEKYVFKDIKTCTCKGCM